MSTKFRAAIFHGVIRETGRSFATNEQCENSGLKAPEFANHALSHNHRILI